MRWLLSAVVLTACAHVDVTAQPSTLAAHAEELRERGVARVEVEQGGTVSVAADDVVVVDLPGTERSHLWGLIKTGRPDQIERMTIGNLVAGCPECVATRARGAIHVGTRRVLDPQALAIGLFGTAGTVVGVTCLSVCTNPGGWAYVGTVIASLVMLAPLATTF